MDRDQLIELLQKNDAFASAPPASIGLLIDAGEIRSLEPKTVIIAQGRQGESIWALLEGEFEVLQGEEIINRMCSPGEVAGEISAVSLTPATATVRADGVAKALCIPQQALHKVMEDNPALAASVLRSMAKYLGRR